MTNIGGFGNFQNYDFFTKRRKDDDNQNPVNEFQNFNFTFNVNQNEDIFAVDAEDFLNMPPDEQSETMSQVLSSFFSSISSVFAGVETSEEEVKMDELAEKEQALAEMEENILNFYTPSAAVAAPTLGDAPNDFGKGTGTVVNTGSGSNNNNNSTQNPTSQFPDKPINDRKIGNPNPDKPLDITVPDDEKMDFDINLIRPSAAVAAPTLGDAPNDFGKGTGTVVNTGGGSNNNNNPMPVGPVRLDISEPIDNDETTSISEPSVPEGIAEIPEEIRGFVSIDDENDKHMRDLIASRRGERKHPFPRRTEQDKDNNVDKYRNPNNIDQTEEKKYVYTGGNVNDTSNIPVFDLSDDTESIKEKENKLTTEEKYINAQTAYDEAYQHLIDVTSEDGTVTDEMILAQKQLQNAKMDLIEVEEEYQKEQNYTEYSNTASKYYEAQTALKDAENNLILASRNGGDTVTDEMIAAQKEYQRAKNNLQTAEENMQSAEQKIMKVAVEDGMEIVNNASGSGDNLSDDELLAQREAQRLRTRAANEVADLNAEAKAKEEESNKTAIDKKISSDKIIDEKTGSLTDEAIAAQKAVQREKNQAIAAAKAEETAQKEAEEKAAAKKAALKEVALNATKEVDAATKVTTTTTTTTTDSSGKTTTTTTTTESSDPYGDDGQLTDEAIAAQKRNQAQRNAILNS